MPPSKPPNLPSSDEPHRDDKHAGWHSRGYLPHFDAAEVIQSVTFRLADSLPRSVLERINAVPWRHSDSEYSRRIEEMLDAGYGNCFLSIPQVAKVVEDALLYFDGVRYQLLAWVIMPNHVHVLMKVFDGFPLGQIIRTYKSYSANKANAYLHRTGKFWYREYFDRYIRNDRHFENVRNYIHANPVKAGLVESPEEWPFSSARLLK